MNFLTIISLFALISACAGLNCYSCASGATGCNDPFSASAFNVTQTGSNSVNIYCVKQGLTSALISRYGSPTCSATAFILGVGTACCQTDLCNGASTNYQAPIILAAIASLIFLIRFH